MSLITLTQAHLAYGHVALLDHTDFSLETGERVGLIGRNGTGKSSLLKILAGLEKPDDGIVQAQTGVRREYVPQEPHLEPGNTVFEVVSEGVAEVVDLRRRYESMAEDEDLDALQTRIEALDGWNWEQRVAQTIDRLKINPDVLVNTLSGGLRKRVALARALVSMPDVLLLDEPTNHLDLDSIDWLAGLLNNFAGALVLITHDRAFLDAVSTRIIELDRGQLRSYPGNFAAFESAKQRELENEALANARFDKLLAQEEIWIRKGVEARRTRSVARIQRLEALRLEHAARRNVQGQVRLDIDTGSASGKLVAELENVSKSYGDKVLVRGFNTTVLRGDKIGLIGPNGVGKTTLLKMILGELAPDSGEVRLGTKMSVAYFDQMRDTLDLDATLADTISPGSEWVEIGNQRKHVKSYLGDFLFSPARSESPVRTLSGGERNRLLLARLFARPANVLVLDEPTNDLDIETLEMLEELLQEYDGTVFLVSHDRRFVDNVVTSTLVWEGDVAPGRWREYEGGIADWIVQRDRSRAIEATAAKAAAAEAARSAPPAPAPTPASAAAPAAPAKPKAKLSYKEQRELSELPGKIEALEQEQATLAALMNGTELYTQGAARISEVTTRHAQIDDDLLTLMERWEELQQRGG